MKKPYQPSVRKTFDDFNADLAAKREAHSEVERQIRKKEVARIPKHLRVLNNGKEY